MSGIPTEADVVAWLNGRLEALALPYRIEHLDILPYMNPMWLSNWDVPQLKDAPDWELIEPEIRDARWRFPQVLIE